MTSYNYSYNVLINRLEAFAAGHFLIKRFTHGQIDLADQLQDDQYPFMHVTPDTITPVQGGMQFGFHIMFADIPRDKEYKAEYQREVISDCIRLGQDLVAEVKNGLQLFGFDVQLVNDVTFEPFMEEQKNTVTGVAFTIKLEVPWDWSACDIPAIWSVGGAGGSGGSGSGYGVTLQTNGVDNVVQTLLNLEAGTNMTITDNGNGTITFDASGGGGGGPYVSTEWNANHTTAQGNQYVIGDRVWYNGSVYACIANNDGINPSNPSYWTLQAAGYRLRQTPVDWNATSGDYQILNKPTLATVATTADYNDLLNLPTIPAAQVNSDWNAVSGVAQILNKPTIPSTLDDLSDVNAPTPSNGQVLTYNTSTGDWEAQTPTPGGSGTVTSVGLTMPAPLNPAFSVGGSPVTTSGTLAVSANGTSAQYIDGTGALQTFPALSGFVPYTGATQDVDLDTNKLSAKSIYIEGTNGAGHLHMKHQNADATATGQSTALWADNNGDIKWKNDGNYKTTLKTSLNTADRVYTFPNEDCTLMPRNAAITGATKTKITYDADGLVTAGADIVASDVSDSSTVGQNLVKLTNPNAITFLRVNADNTVTARTPAQVLTDLGIASSIILARDFAIYSLTGTTTNTLVWSQSITANTLQANDFIEWFAQFQTNMPNGTAVNYRIYINTSASLVGASLLGTYTNTVGTGSTGFQRNIFVTASGVSGNLRVSLATTASSVSYFNASGNLTNVTVDTTITQHLIVAIQHGNTTATSSLQSNIIRITR